MVLALILSLSAALAGQASELEGAWVCTCATIDGRPLAPEAAAQLRLTLTGNRYQTARGGQVLFDSTFTLDPARQPKQIDLIGTEGELKGKAALGIYKLEGDQLTICYVMPGSERPKTFESPPQSGVFLVVWKRAEAK